jgi:glycerol-3-phosphate dehydrogenase (NAD(P)+)
MDQSALHRRARERGVQPILYWLARAVLQPFFHLYFRLSRIGREHVPADGPFIVAANHRSFLDPFVIATIARRPLYYVAKRELFEKRWQGWLLNALGAFPVDRGNSDAEMLETARTILARGDSVLIFPEGTRIRPGALGRPRRGVGRLALETGVPVLPVAVIGTEDVRRRWRIRPRKVRIRIGRPLTFPRVQTPSPELAAAVTDRIWPCVMLQWEWLGGLPPFRRAAVVGNGRWAQPLTDVLARAGLQVDRDPLEIERQDLVVLTEPVVPLAVTEAIAPGAAVLLAGGTAQVPQARMAELRTVEGGPEDALLIVTADRGAGRQLRDVFAVAGREAAVERVAA